MIKIGDTFRLSYCPKVQFKLKRIDKQTKIHTFQMLDGTEFGRKETEIDVNVNGWEQIL